MNKIQFEENIKRLGYSKMNLPFLTDWYANTAKSLGILSKQKKGVKHPRHRGDAREDDFISVLKSVMPTTLGISKGIVVSLHGFQSSEQDCMIFDSSVTARLASAGDIHYIPVDSILCSVEVKSNLTIAELRKAILNVAGLKKLRYKNSNEANYFKPPNDGNEILSFVFAYSSSFSPTKLAEKLTELNKDIPPNLRINAVFILNSGLILNKKTSYSFTSKEMLSCEHEYAAIENLGGDNEEYAFAIHFLILQAALIDHSINESKRRAPPEYRNYVLTPVIWFDQIKKSWSEKHSPDELQKLLKGIRIGTVEGIHS